jgi:hypothetical protein
MILVGLTGGIATGKSTVASIFRRFGATVIDADQLAREVVRPGKPAWREIVKSFGKRVLLPDRTIDRPAPGPVASGARARATGRHRRRGPIGRCARAPFAPAPIATMIADAPPSTSRMTSTDPALRILRTTFGHTDFRGSQRAIVDHLPQSPASRCYRIVASRLAGLGPAQGGLRLAAGRFEEEKVTQCA